MSIMEKFLQMEIRQQIRLTIYMISFCSTIFFSGLFICYSYEILIQSYFQEKQYFLDMKSAESSGIMFFQNINLLLYEETIKLMINQVFNYFYAKQFYINNSIFNDSYLNEHIFYYNSSNESNNSFYYFSDVNEDLDKAFKNNIIKAMPMIKIIQNQKSIIFNNSLMKDFIVFENELNLVFSTNKKAIEDIASQINHEKKILSLYNELIEKHNNSLFYFLQLKVLNRLPMLDIIFPTLMKDFENYYNKSSKELFSNYSNLLSNLTKFQPIIDYNISKVSLIDTLNISNIKMIVANDLSYDYINELFGLILLYKDKFIAIPVDENDTLISEASCFYFLLYQKIVEHKNISNEFIQDLYYKISKGVTKIDDCFNYINKKDILYLFDGSNKNNVYFYQKQTSDLFNKLFYNNFGILKYGYPSYKSLLLFSPIYIFDNHFYVYLIVNFSSTYYFIDRLKQVLMNCFYGIIIFCILIWICLIVILCFIERKISLQVILPIKKLKQCIETKNINDDKIFEYPADKSINELFQTCKELLKGDLYYKKKLINKENDDTYFKNQNLIINNEIISDMILNDNLDKVDQDDIQYFEKFKYREIIENKKRKMTNEILRNRGSMKEKKFKKSDILLNQGLNNNNIKDDFDEELKLYNSFFQLGEMIFDKKTIEDLKKENENNNLCKKNSQKSREEENEEVNIIHNKKSILYYWYMNIKKKRNGNVHIHKRKKTLFNLKETSSFQERKLMSAQEKREKLKMSIDELKLSFKKENNLNEINTSKHKLDFYD